MSEKKRSLINSTPSPPSGSGINRNSQNQKNTMNEGKCTSDSRPKTARSLTPGDFFFIKTIGEGSFSTVYYAKEVDTGHEYAIKVLIKSDMCRGEKVKQVLREKEILTQLTYKHGGHPFLVNLYSSFQDSSRLYFAITYAKYGELLNWLHRLGSFDEEATLFYASEILSALEFLHNAHIVHRDLKPENILVSHNWHIMVSDFGSAKIIEDSVDQPADDHKFNPISNSDNSCETSPVIDKKRGNTRNSFVGTAHYISPEVLKSEEVGPECDFWALGAIIFQMISGQPPFRAVNEYKILKKILNLEFSFPDGFPEVSKDLITHLLLLNPLERLGSSNTGGISALKSHQFFKNIDWENLPKKKPPELKPYIPASSGEPAFYGEYQIQEFDPVIEPGLTEAALHRLMGFDSQYESNSKGNLESVREARDENPFQIDGIDRDERLERQKQIHKYHQFTENNLILKCGLIDKKKGLFARRRMFLLTEGPHLFYVDPVTMHLKGEIKFCPEMRTEAKNFRTFFVHTPKRTYFLFDPERRAKEWCDAIHWVRDYYLKRSKISTSIQNPVHK